MSTRSRQSRALRRLEQSKKIMQKGLKSKKSCTTTKDPDVQVEIESGDTGNTIVNVYCNCKHGHHNDCNDNDDCDTCPIYDDFGYPYDYRYSRPVLDCTPIHTPYGPVQACVLVDTPMNEYYAPFVRPFNPFPIPESGFRGYGGLPY